jgi:hypothetical protein
LIVAHVIVAHVACLEIKVCIRSGFDEQSKKTWNSEAYAQEQSCADIGGNAMQDKGVDK